MLTLASLVDEWDREYEAELPTGSGGDHRQPYDSLLAQITGISEFRLQPFQNDELPTFVEKLKRWLVQFEEADQRLAFLLACHVIFVTPHQFDALQRQLFEGQIKRHLLNAAITRYGYHPLDYASASNHLEEEMNLTLFISNSDSSPLNSFVHINSRYFNDRERRRLVGEPVKFWTYPARRAKVAKSSKTKIAAQRFERIVLQSDRRLKGKQRLVVIEDFAGTGLDLLSTLDDLYASDLGFTEILIAPIMATEEAVRELSKKCATHTDANRQFAVVCPYVLPDELSCIRDPESYLNDFSPVPSLSREVRRLSDKIYDSHFSSLPEAAKYGFGSLALAFAFYTNCPDNSLPLIWSSAGGWYPLFRRASRYL